MKRIPDRQITFKDIATVSKSSLWHHIRHNNSQWRVITSNVSAVAAYDGFMIYWEKLS